MYEASPGTASTAGKSAEELATDTAISCFDEADTNRDGRIDFEEFVAWSKSGSASGEAKQEEAQDTDGVLGRLFLSCSLAVCVLTRISPSPCCLSHQNCPLLPFFRCPEFLVCCFSRLSAHRL